MRAKVLGEHAERESNQGQMGVIGGKIMAREFAIQDLVGLATHIFVRNDLHTLYMASRLKYLLENFFRDPRIQSPDV